MVLTDDEIIKQGIFNVRYSSAKKYQHEKGKLPLTNKSFSLIFNNNPNRNFGNDQIRLQVSNGCLKVYDTYHSKLWFTLLVDEPQEWKQIFDKNKMEKTNRHIIEMYATKEQKQKELQKLFDMSPQALKKLYQDTLKEREQFQRKNIRFNLEIQSSYLYEGTKDQKLRAFVVAHSYAAWCEWITKILGKVMKAKTGKGPDKKNPLSDFLDDYPTLKKSMYTTDWEIKLNQLRNCVAHERFYFDYKHSEIVFMDEKEKRIRLTELRSRLLWLKNCYVELLHFLEESVRSIKSF